MFARKSLNYVRDWARTQEVANYFGQQAFLRLAVFVVAFAWLWIGYNRQVGLLDPGSGLVLMFIILIAGGLTFWLYQTNYLWAVYVFLASQLLFISSMLWVSQDLNIGYSFILVIVIAGSLIGPLGAFATAIGIITIELLLASIMPGLVETSTSLMGVIFLQVLAASVAAQASSGFYNALESVEMSAHLASEHAEEARQHRGKLVRALKSLDLAHNQLQRANAELFRAREVADKALRFKAEFAAKVSHELRTSLNLILGFSETMAFAQESYGNKLPTPYLRDVTEIYRNSRHLLSLIDDILDLSKLEAGRMGLRREPVKLATILQETTDLIRPLTETKGLDLKLELPNTLPTLNLDRTRINQVLLNLLSNATRITSSGQIVVKARQREEEVEIQVSDTGLGIQPDDLNQVFEEFRQLERTEGASGTTGLGLTVSKQIVELHGGQIWVESVWGEGSTFIFTLPTQDINIPQSIAVSPIGPYRPPKPTFIVIGEAESDEVKLLERHLEGYTLAVTSDWKDIQQLITQMSARGVIVSMPLSDIPDSSDVPVPIVACPLPGPQQSKTELNVDYYLQKPVTAHALQKALSHIAPTAKNLLIVDDNPSTVRMLERMVQTTEKEFQVFKAYSGDEALGRVKAQIPDAIVLDLIMPNGDGYSLISKLRQDPKMAHIPIIVASGQIVEETWQGGPIGIINGAGFTPTDTLHYLQALLSVIPPTLVEYHTTAQPSSKGLLV